MLSKQFCCLEGKKFTKPKKEIAIFSGVAARISDDLIDASKVKSDEFYLLGSNSNYKQTEPEKKLFYIFNSELEKLVSRFKFKHKFKNLIKRYNLAQKKGLLLKKRISTKKLISIKNETGGFPFLLL